MRTSHCSSLSDGAGGFRAVESVSALLVFFHASISVTENKKTTRFKNRHNKQAEYYFSVSGSCHFSLLVEQLLQYGLRAREGSVGGEEDGRVGEVVVSERREQSLHQSLQRSSTDTSDFAGLQLAHRVAGRQAIPFRLNKKHANYDKFKQKPPETYSTAVGKSTAGTQ